LDRQFLRNFDLASRTRGNTGEQLLSLMERRMDNVVYRMGWAGSRAAARQLVVHGHFSLNGKHVDIPSLLVKPGDVVSVKSRERSLSLVRKLAEVVGRKDAPPYLEAQGSESDPLQCRMTRLPSRTDVDPRLEDQGPLREQLIIEFCSR
jgi:small subunit ribosomal protein S4